MAGTGRRVLDFAIGGPIARSDLPGLCRSMCGLLGQSSARVAVCDVRGVEPDAVTVDALGRLQLYVDAVLERATVVRRWLEAPAICECPSLDDCCLIDEATVLPPREGETLPYASN